MWTETIVEALNRDEELPFGGYRKGAGIDARGLAKLLRPFRIRPRDVRLGEDKAKGYRSEWFTDAWERYCTDPPGSDDLSATSATSALQSQNPAFSDPRQTAYVADTKTAQNPHGNADVAGVADRNAQTGGAGSNDAILLTFAGDPLPADTVEIVLALRAIFDGRDAMSQADIVAELDGKWPELKPKTLAARLEAAGITPLPIKMAEGRTLKGYRRGWFEGYFEQAEHQLTDADALIGKIARAFDATEVAVPPCERHGHAGREWRLASGGQWVCGVCHPPSLEVIWATSS
jgi:hypothetical protein